MIDDKRLMVVASIATLVVVLFALERAFPLRRARRPLGRRLAVNAAVAVTALATAFAIVVPVTTAAMMQAARWRVGLLHWLDLPPWAALAAGFLLLDLSFYLWHRANHGSSLLWRFHSAHHVDPDLDVSTAYRFHFGEVALSALFRLVQVFAIGASPTTIAVYEAAFHANTLFQHSNLRLPLRVERWLNHVLVTPRMHGIHHSEIREENRSNFSVVLPWWDRLMRTIRLNVPQDGVNVGIAGYRGASDNELANVLAMPFRAQRDYWRGADGADTLARAPAPRDGLGVLIA